MNTQEIDPKAMATNLLLLSKETVAAKCKELNIPPTDSKLKMIDQIIVSTFGLDACKKGLCWPFIITLAFPPNCGSVGCLSVPALAL
jgi:hypothetical protein